MNEILELLRHQLAKMATDGSWIFGAVSGGIAIVIPEWIYTPGWSNFDSIIALANHNFWSRKRTSHSRKGFIKHGQKKNILATQQL